MATWPGLYDPSPELKRRPDSNPTPPGTLFLSNANGSYSIDPSNQLEPNEG